MENVATWAAATAEKATTRTKPRIISTNGAVCRDTLLRLRHNPQIRLRRFPAARILLLGFFLRHRGQDDHVLAILPIYRRSNFVLRSELHRIQNAQHFVEI